MARNYAALLHEYIREMGCLTDAEFGRLCRALIQYSADGTPIALGGNERFFAERVMMQEERFQQSYEELSAARSEGGKKGMANRWHNKDNSVMGVITGDNKNNNIETEIEIKTDPPPATAGGGRAKRARFVPPTVEEVAAYCRERGNNVDPERFVAYYTANGWRVGKNPMKDWKAAVRTWERNGLDVGQASPQAEDPAPDAEKLEQMRRMALHLGGGGTHGG